MYLNTQTKKNQTKSHLSVYKLQQCNRERKINNNARICTWSWFVWTEKRKRREQHVVDFTFISFFLLFRTRLWWAENGDTYMNCTNTIIRTKKRFTWMNVYLFVIASKKYFSCLTTLLNFEPMRLLHCWSLLIDATYWYSVYVWYVCTLCTLYLICISACLPLAFESFT